MADDASCLRRLRMVLCEEMATCSRVEVHDDDDDGMRILQRLPTLHDDNDGDANSS